VEHADHPHVAAQGFEAMDVVGRRRHDAELARPQDSVLDDLELGVAVHRAVVDSSVRLVVELSRVGADDLPGAVVVHRDADACREAGREDPDLAVPVQPAARGAVVRLARQPDLEEVVLLSEPLEQPDQVVPRRRDVVLVRLEGGVEFARAAARCVTRGPTAHDSYARLCRAAVRTRMPGAPACPDDRA